MPIQYDSSECIYRGLREFDTVRFGKLHRFTADAILSKCNPEGRCSYVSTKCWHVYTKLHGVTSQTIVKCIKFILRNT